MSMRIQKKTKKDKKKKKMTREEKLANALKRNIKLRKENKKLINRSLFERKNFN